jgi:hypothetical protein
MQRKSIFITAALLAGLALGIIVGPTVRSSVASAQAQPPGQSQSVAPVGTLWNLFLDNLATTLKIRRSALDSAITSAGTSTADAAVQQGTLTQAQADALKARIQAGDLGALLGGRGGPGGPSGAHQLGGVKQATLGAAAKALNITTAELQTQLRSGQTLAQLAQAHNTTEQAVITAALAAAKSQLDQAVGGGSLTQAQADTVYAQLQQQGANLFNPRGRGRPVAPAAPQAPATSPQGDV